MLLFKKFVDRLATFPGCNPASCLKSAGIGSGISATLTDTSCRYQMDGGREFFKLKFCYKNPKKSTKQEAKVTKHSKALTSVGVA